MLNLSSHELVRAECFCNGAVDVLSKSREHWFVFSAYISDNLVCLRRVVVLVGQLSFSIFPPVIQGTYQQHFIFVLFCDSVGEHRSFELFSVSFSFNIFSLRLYLEAILVYLCK